MSVQAVATIVVGLCVYLACREIQQGLHQVGRLVENGLTVAGNGKCMENELKSGLREGIKSVGSNSVGNVLKSRLTEGTGPPKCGLSEGGPDGFSSAIAEGVKSVENGLTRIEKLIEKSMQRRLMEVEILEKAISSGVRYMIFCLLVLSFFFSFLFWPKSAYTNYRYR